MCIRDWLCLGLNLLPRLRRVLESLLLCRRYLLLLLLLLLGMMLRLLHLLQHRELLLIVRQRNSLRTKRAILLPETVEGCLQMLGQCLDCLVRSLQSRHRACDGC